MGSKVLHINIVEIIYNDTGCNYILGVMTLDGKFLQNSYISCTNLYRL